MLSSQRSRETAMSDIQPWQIIALENGNLTPDDWSDAVEQAREQGQRDEREKFILGSPYLAYKRQIEADEQQRIRAAVEALEFIDPFVIRAAVLAVIDGTPPAP
jgi:hypothetical protein